MLSIKLIQQCKAGNVNTVKRLITENADVNVMIFGSSPLLAALESNNINLLNALIDVGVDIAGFTHENKTALMVATTQCRLEIVRCLLQHQPPALLDARDEDGYTALVLALSHDKLDIASTLLDSGADASIASNNGTTALIECRDVTLATRLLELGVDLHARDDDGMNALLVACMYGNIEMVVLLLDHGADTYSEDDVGSTTLMLAASEGDAEMIEALLEMSADEDDDVDELFDWINARNDDGDTALHIAVRGGHVDCVQALIDGGAYPNMPSTADGSLPLQLTSDVAIARILLDAGAEDFEADEADETDEDEDEEDIDDDEDMDDFDDFDDLDDDDDEDDDEDEDDEADEADGDGDIAKVIISACKDPARIEVLRLLLQRFPDSEPKKGSYLFHAADNQNLEAVRLLIEGKTVEYINKRGLCGFTALTLTGSPDIMRLLLVRGADPCVVDDCGQTPIMRFTNATRMRLLLDAAPELVGIRDNEGRIATAHLSCSDVQFPMLVRLLQYCEEHGIDAEINNKDVNGDTALHVAMVWSTDMAVELLLEKGAEVMGIGCRGTTVLMKPFLENEFYLSKYSEMRRVTVSRSARMNDAYASACLRMVLNAVLLRGAATQHRRV